MFYYCSLLCSTKGANAVRRGVSAHELDDDLDDYEDEEGAVKAKAAAGVQG